MSNTKFQKEAGFNPKFKFPVLYERLIRNAAKVLHDVAWMCRDEFTEYIATQLDRYLDGCLEFRECPRPEGFVDKSGGTVEGDDGSKE